MIENEDGTVAGSIDRTRVVELLKEAKNDEQRAYYRGLLGDSPEGKAAAEDAENAKSSKSSDSGAAKKAAASPKSGGGDG